RTMAWPKPVKYVPVSTTTRPVTHVADTAVNSASKKRMRPGPTVAPGRHSSAAPSRITARNAAGKTRMGRIPFRDVLTVRLLTLMWSSHYTAEPDNFQCFAGFCTPRLYPSPLRRLHKSAPGLYACRMKRFPSRSVAVVGGLNLDIYAIPDIPPQPRDSTPGRVLLSVGGVGHNIARHLAA